MLSVGIQLCTLPCGRGNENMNYFILLNGNRTHNSRKLVRSAPRLPKPLPLRSIERNLLTLGSQVPSAYLLMCKIQREDQDFYSVTLISIFCPFISCVERYMRNYLALLLSYMFNLIKTIVKIYLNYKSKQI